MTNKGDPRYALEKFSSAVHEMARSEKPLRERLYDRLDGALRNLSAVGPEDMPHDLALETFTELKTIMNSAPSEAISDADVRRMAQLVCDIHADLTPARRESR